jgi:hypothetical protein
MIRISSSAALLAGCLLLAAAPRGAAAADEPCSGHGSLSDGRCECENAWPDDGAQGWIGAACEVPLFGHGAAVGTDIAPGAELLPGGKQKTHPGK